MLTALLWPPSLDSLLLFTEACRGCSHIAFIFAGLPLGVFLGAWPNMKIAIHKDMCIFSVCRPRGFPNAGA